MNIMKMIERLSPRKPGVDIDAIASQLFTELSAQPEPRDPTEMIKALTDLGVRGDGKIPSEAECRALVDVLSHLPLRQRMVMELSLQDYTPREIAKVLGITLAVAIREHAKVMALLREREIS